MTLALEFQAYKGKADQHISHLEQLLKSKDQRQVTQGGDAEQRIAELEAQLAGGSKNAVSEYSALMKKLAETTAAADTSNSIAQRRISDLEQQLERQGRDDNESMSKLQKRIVELESQLTMTKDQMMGLAQEYMVCLLYPTMTETYTNPHIILTYSYPYSCSTFPLGLQECNRRKKQ